MIRRSFFTTLAATLATGIATAATGVFTLPVWRFLRLRKKEKQSIVEGDSESSDHSTAIERRRLAEAQLIDKANFYYKGGKYEVLCNMEGDLVAKRFRWGESGLNVKAGIFRLPHDYPSKEEFMEKYMGAPIL